MVYTIHSRPAEMTTYGLSLQGVTRASHLTSRPAFLDSGLRRNDGGGKIKNLKKH